MFDLIEIIFLGDVMLYLFCFYWLFIFCLEFGVVVEVFIRDYGEIYRFWGLLKKLFDILKMLIAKIVCYIIVLMF